MIEFNWPALFHTRLLAAPCVRTAGTAGTAGTVRSAGTVGTVWTVGTVGTAGVARRGCYGVARSWCVRCGRVVLYLGRRSLRLGPSASARRINEWGGFAVCRCECVGSAGSGRSAEWGFGALNAAVRLRLPVAAVAMIEKCIGPRLGMCMSMPLAVAVAMPMGAFSLVCSPCDGLHGSPHWCRYSDGVRVISTAAFDSIAGGEECIEALNEGGVASKKLGNAIDHTWRVDTKGWKMSEPAAVEKINGV